MRRSIWTPRLALVLALAIVPTVVFAAGTKKKEKPADTAESLYTDGVATMEGGDHAGAADHFRKAVEAKPDFAEAHNNLAYCLRKQGAEHYTMAKKHYDKAIELKPDLAQAYHYRGVLHALQGDEAAAKADLAKLAELDRELADELMQVIASGEEPAGHGGTAGKWK
ncbi:MAG: tetratricopeptide repeat protein [Acidobacteriota bacterium]